MGVEWLVLCVLAALGVGGGGGYAIAKRQSGQAASEAERLQGELEASQQALEDYRSEVLAQFGDTAEKFRALDASYHDLHRQLANSAQALLGEAPGPLLTGPAAEALEETVVTVDSETTTDGAEPLLDDVVQESEHAAAQEPDAALEIEEPIVVSTPSGSDESSEKDPSDPEPARTETR